jgi:hypothetical protein
MNFLEKNLEDIIFENKTNLESRGLVNLFYEKTKRQVILPNGKKIDILTWEVRDNIIYARIIELKKDTIDESAFFQGLYYHEYFICAIGGYYDGYEIEVVFIGSNMYENVKTVFQITDCIRYIQYSYKHDGISFKEMTLNKSNMKFTFSICEKDDNTENFNNMLNS